MSDLPHRVGQAAAESCWNRMHETECILERISKEASDVMTSKPEPLLRELGSANLETMACCGVKNPVHDGRRQKHCWMRAYFKKGLRAKVLLTPDNRQCGYIEYLPGEFAWRGVDASGYLFIHCLWTFYRQYQRRGFGTSMVQAVMDDARKEGRNGVAVVTRDRPWLAGAGIFLASGFEIVDTAPPDYKLLVKKLNPSAPDPVFKGGWERKLLKYGRGLTIIRSRQCPHIAKFAAEIALVAEEEYGLKPRIVELKSHRDAQNAPTPYAVFAVILNGRLLTDHQVSCTRFRNLMKRNLP